jgi:hypothetical protein
MTDTKNTNQGDRMNNSHEEDKCGQCIACLTKALLSEMRSQPSSAVANFVLMHMKYTEIGKVHRAEFEDISRRCWKQEILTLVNQSASNSEKMATLRDEFDLFALRVVCCSFMDLHLHMQTVSPEGWGQA